MHPSYGEVSACFHADHPHRLYPMHPSYGDQLFPTNTSRLPMLEFFFTNDSLSLIHSVTTKMTSSSFSPVIFTPLSAISFYQDGEKNREIIPQ
jgi:hypothetical protein